MMALWSLPAQAKPLIADMSQHHINIDSGFTGTSLLLFGAREDAGTIVAVVRGPEHDVTVRRKERVGGIWVNTRGVRFRDVPYFYALASTRPLAEFEDALLLKRLRIGQEAALDATEDEMPFKEAFLRDRYALRLYRPEGLEVSFMGETLFKTVIEFPEATPRGDYTAEVYLLRDGALVGMQSTPLRVQKQGFDALVFDVAHGAPLFYGVFAVAMALSVGWLAGLAFRKI